MGQCMYCHVESKVDTKRAAKGGARTRTPAHLEKQEWHKGAQRSAKATGQRRLWDVKTRLDVRWTSEPKMHCKQPIRDTSEGSRTKGLDVRRTSAPWELRLRSTVGDVVKTLQKGWASAAPGSRLVARDNRPPGASSQPGRVPPPLASRKILRWSHCS